MARWLVALLLLVSIAPAQCQKMRDGKMEVAAVGNRGGLVGFDVLCAGKTVAQSRFSSAGLIAAKQCRVNSRSRLMKFTGLAPKPGSGLRLDPADYISVALKPGDPYPVVAFHISIRGFDPVKWQSVAGKQPFHFITLLMPEAKTWHHRGWLNATPLADPFPLLLDAHVGTPEISAYRYNRNWSYTPPLAAHPIPVIGLWDPDGKRYAGFEFQSTRLEDNSEKAIATGYRWNGGKTEPQMVSLVYPYGGEGYQTLVFPKAGDVLNSRCVLLWSTSLSASDDPNCLFFNYVWSRMRAKLPQVPSTPDMGWLPGGIRLSDFEGPPQGGVISGTEGGFQVPGTRLLSGWRWQCEMPTTVAAKENNTGRMRQLESEATELLRYVKKFKAGGDECLYWEKPFEGSWTKEWGGAGVTSLHNANGFAAGRLYLGLYRDAGHKEHLPIVDGVFNWAKHVAWTRNEFADVPSSPFAIGGTLPTSFCLDYYSTFRNSPDSIRRRKAKEALELARSFTYRYLILWLSDNDRQDNLRPEFLWEPNSGRDWTGAACSNEVFWNLDTLAQAAVVTGDPILRWALDGSLNRWHALYQEKYKEGLENYQPSDMTEGYGLAPGNVYGVGVRAQYGFASPLAMIEPVGTTTVRVLAGEKAAMVFKKGTGRYSIRDYRCATPGNFSFVLQTDQDRVELSLTFPYTDVSTRAVSVVRNGKLERLVPEQDFIRPPQAPWSLRINELKNGDRVVVGSDKREGSVLPSSPPLAIGQAPPPQPGIFESVKLPYDMTADADWNHANSWAGLPRGPQWSFGVSYTLAPDAVPCVATRVVKFTPPLRGAESIVLLYAEGATNPPSVLLANGTKIKVSSDLESMAWQAWPPYRGRKLLMSAATVHGSEIAAIDPGDASVWAATLVRLDKNRENSTSQYNAVTQALKIGNHEWQLLKRNDAVAASLKKELDSVSVGSIAVMPPNPSGLPINLAMRAGLSTRGVFLTPAQLADHDTFNAKRFPVAVYAGGEDYIHTVNSNGDAADNTVQYVKEGGTLVLLSGQPFPMCYAVGPGFHRGEPLTERLGIPIYNSFEVLPEGKLSAVLVAGQDVMNGLPERFAYPSGDPRLRCIDPARLPSGAKYTPIYRIMDETGKSYGDAAGLVELQGGGRILYVANVLFRSPEFGQNLVTAALRYTFNAAK